MKKLAMFVGGTALAAGVVLVPVGAASAATTTSTTRTAAAPVTSVHPQDVFNWQCEEAGGYVAYDAYSPSGYVCVGGWYNGEVVWF